MLYRRYPPESPGCHEDIEADGWYLVTTKGSHRQNTHPVKPGRITIARHPADELAPPLWHHP